MAHVVAQVRFRRDNSLPADAIINTFHFRTADQLILDTEKTGIVTRLLEFYNTNQVGGGSPVGAYMSNLLATTDHRMKLYDMAAPKPRAPIYDEPFNLASPLASTNLFPAEVALCISFRAALLSGTIARRRRGRVYIGPLGPSVAGGNGDIRPAFTMQENFVKAAARLRDGPGPKWSVYSEIGAGLADVSHVWVDNTFDSQRRRGTKPTSRLQDPL